MGLFELGPCKLRNETETKHSEAKRSEAKRSETKRNTTKGNKICKLRNETKQNM